MSKRNKNAEHSNWNAHHAEFRDPHEIVSQWQGQTCVPKEVLKFRVVGDWWELLAKTGMTLFATREYEHLIVAFSTQNGNNRCSYFRLPHPSGLAVDAERNHLFAASTRNPNVVYKFGTHKKWLLPVTCNYLPGRMYLHDLAVIGNKLYGNAVGMNAVAELPPNGGYKTAWWPKAIEIGPRGAPRFDKNFLQINSIAAGRTLADSFFTASAAVPSSRRPGHLNFPVDGRGVIFSGRTREVVATGLTRPHSARLSNDQIWVDNSGYGELGVIKGGSFTSVAKLPGWTRGLCLHDGIAWVGTSRIIPRFQHYAPGVSIDRALAGVHAVDMSSGKLLASLIWPNGNQLFAIEMMPRNKTCGFSFDASKNPKVVVKYFFNGANFQNAASRSS